ncbi:histidine kinase dimerization/phosphoacceptor domain -containing protein [Zoogloea sp. 1C4]|uniref:histidine kinase dimerization/phosphoacceptor domain -containing protein n=1 Tax=Zoogloea sp. 1C4 TaxID=2570190 RepID=UPI001291DB89|nr:histidine kinase dimerization/phosphoacceptor domain -containing protein [Zoogloea sp. 1C4]
MLRVFTLLAMLAALVFGPVAARTDAPVLPVAERKTVLVINSYHWGFAWTDAQVSGILQVLRSGDAPPEVFVHDLDALRQPRRDDDAGTVAHLRQRVGERRVDLVIVTDDPALDFALRHRDALFPKASVVFSDVRDFDPARVRPDVPITGVRENVDIVGTLGAARKLLPDARRMVVFGNLGGSATGFAHAHEALLKMGSPLPVEQYFDLGLSEILTIVARLSPNDIILPLATAVDDQGRRLDYSEVITRMAQVSPAPVFDITSHRVRDGITIGGSVEDGVTQGRVAAGMARRVLAGTPARSLPVVDAEPVLLFNHTVMERFGVPESRLPEGAQLIGKPPGVVERSGGVFWAMLAALVALTVVIVVLIANIKRLNRAESVLEQSEEHLRLAVEGATDGIWDWNLKTGAIYVSPRYFTMLGYEVGELELGPEALMRQIHPDDREATEARFREFIASPDAAFRAEFRMRAKSGEWRWILSRGAVVKRKSDGRALRVAGSHADITDAKIAEQRISAALHEKEALLKEIYHRVKNNLQVVASLLTMQGRSVDDADVRELFEDSAARVMAMSQVHEQLYRSHDLASIDFKRYLGQLVERLASQHGRQGVRIESALDQVVLGIETAIPCALIVNELVSNAVKHAFPHGSAGRIQVGLQADGEDGARLWVEDDGVGLQPGFSPATSRSLGWRLVVGLVNQIGGKLVVGADTSSRIHSGTRIVIRFQPDAPESRRYADALPLRDDAPA